MNIYRLTCAVAGFLFFAAASRYLALARQEMGDKKRDGLISLSRAQSPRELAIRINKSVSSAPTGDLHQLVTDPDCTVALAAGWERVWRTLPTEEQDEPVVPDEQVVARFLGLLEGRIRILIPKEWETAVKSVKARGGRKVAFSVPEHREQPMPGHGFLRGAGNKWYVKTVGQLIKLPADAALYADHAVVDLSAERAYTALYTRFPYPYKLYATDRGTGEIIWSTLVWADGDWMGYGGAGWHLVMMRLAGDRIIMFGITFRSVYVEVFDIKTGKVLCRFSTTYSDRSAPRE
jgi:hypothetical protein